MKHLPFDATILVLNSATSALGVVTSALVRNFRLYWYGVSGDCGVGITPQMCNRVTNHGDMDTCSKPGEESVCFKKKREFKFIDKLFCPLIYMVINTEYTNVVHFFINSELKCKPHENTACVFLTSVTWTILQMEIDGNLKKMRC